MEIRPKAEGELQNVAWNLLPPPQDKSAGEGSGALDWKIGAPSTPSADGKFHNKQAPQQVSSPQCRHIPRDTV